MDTALFEELAMQSVEGARRAAERSVRGLAPLGPEGERRPPGRAVLEQFLADSRADLAALHTLRRTADELLREGMEAEAFRRYCETALEAADLTMAGAATAAKAGPDVLDATPGSQQVLAEIRDNAEQAQALHRQFRPLVEWLRVTPAPLPQAVLEKLETLPPVSEPEGDGSRPDSALGV